jgi:hypothetical protein
VPMCEFPDLRSANKKTWSCTAGGSIPEASAGFYLVKSLVFYKAWIKY